MTDRVPVAYLRKSRLAPFGRDVSHEMQEREVRALADKYGDADRLVFLEDWGVSGSREKQHRRDGYNRLIEMIGSDQVSACYGYSLSRLSRSLPSFLELADLAVAHRAEIRLCKEGTLDFQSSSGRLMMNILAMFAQFELQLARDRSQDAANANKARGIALGNAPFGKSKVDKRLVDDPEEQEIIEGIVETYGRTRSLAGTARWLNENGVRTKSGRGKWAPETIKGIIQRTAPSMVTAGVQQGRSGRGSTRLAGLLICHCGATMSGRFYRGRWVSYTCKRGSVDPDHPRPVTVSEKKLWKVVSREVAKLRFDVEKAEDLDARAANIAKERTRLVDAFQAGVLTDEDDLKRRLENIAARIDQIHRDQAMVLAVARPQGDDHGDWNVWLRRVYERIELDENLRPVRIVPRMAGPAAVLEATARVELDPIPTATLSMEPGKVTAQDEV